MQLTTLSTLRTLPHALQMTVAVLCLGFATSFAAPYLSLFGAQRVGLDPLHIGIFMSTLAVSGIVVSTQLARLSDRLGDRRPVVLLSVVGAVIGYALLCVTTSFWGLIAAAVLFLGAGAAAFPQLFAYAKSRMGGVSAETAEHGLTTLRSVFSLAWVLGPGLGALIQAWAGFSGLFAASALLYAVAGAAVLYRSGEGHAAALTAPPVQAAPVGPRPHVPLVVASFVLYGASMSMGFIALPLLVTKVLGGSNGDVGLIVGICALLEIPMMMSFVLLPRRYSAQRLIMLAFGLFALYFVGCYVAQGTGLLIMVQLIRAGVIAVSASLGMAYFQQLMPDRVGAATTLFANTSSAGSMVAGVVSGAVAQAAGYREVFLLCAVLTLLAWLLLFAATRVRAGQAGQVSAERAGTEVGGAERAGASTLP